MLRSGMFKKKSLNLLGLMSGTSCDGLDIALVTIWEEQGTIQIALQQGKTYQYSGAQKEYMLRILHQKASNLKDISQFNFYLAHLWADMVKQFNNEFKQTENSIDLIASHGQTVWHEPNYSQIVDKEIISTLQLGDPHVLAQLTKIPVVGDFRVADMALGGQGAPLIPYLDWVFFKRFKKNMLIVNVGGISNFTYIPASGQRHKVKAFDCGPGNMLIDGAVKELYNRSYDKDGTLASKGKAHKGLLDFLILSDPFPDTPPPKSTGREHYNSGFLKRTLEFCKTHAIRGEDIIHTLTEYTAYTIHRNFELYIKDDFHLDDVVISGGGANNSFMMKKIEDYFAQSRIVTSDTFNLNSDFKESIGFALLAYETIQGRPSNLPALSGAKSDALLGKICMV